MNEIREYVNNMILTKVDYRINRKFKRELRREIEFRNTRRMWNIREIMNTDYPSDDLDDSDFSPDQTSSDEMIEHMIFSANVDEMTLGDESNATQMYDMSNINEEISNISKNTKLVLDKTEQLLAYSEDFEGLLNANIGDDEARNEVVDRHFLHVDMALAKQNQEIMYVRDKLFAEIMMLRNDVRRAGVNLLDRNPRESSHRISNTNQQSST